MLICLIKNTVKHENYEIFLQFKVTDFYLFIFKKSNIFILFGNIIISVERKLGHIKLIKRDRTKHS